MMLKARLPAAQRSTRGMVCKAQLSMPQRVGTAAAASLVSAGLLVAPAFAGVSFKGLPSGSAASPLHVEMAVKGMELRPAADGVIEGTGHFHVFIDSPDVAAGVAIPFDDAHKHFGKAQAATDLELAPGKHQLTLQFANALHESYGSEWSQKVTVNIK